MPDASAWQAMTVTPQPPEIPGGLTVISRAPESAVIGSVGEPGQSVYIRDATSELVFLIRRDGWLESLNKGSGISCTARLYHEKENDR
jgi:hypothetical protein